jgi:hypothetical protein
MSSRLLWELAGNRAQTYGRAARDGEPGCPSFFCVDKESGRIGSLERVTRWEVKVNEGRL